MKYSLIFLVAISLVACHRSSDNLIDKNIHLARENKKELIKIRDNFEESSQKRLASDFLLKYMGNKGYLDSVKQFHSDVENVKSDFIISDLNNAFVIWELSKWKHEISFETFCKYILPYRVGNEKVEDWRKYFYERYKHFSKNSFNMKANARLIAKDILNWYTYKSDYYPIVQTQSLSNILKNKSGVCGDIANTLIYAFRANNIPAAKEYVSFWGGRNMGHVEAVFLTDSNRFTPLTEDTFRFFAAKVYRTTYSSIEPESEKIKKLGLMIDDIPSTFFAITGEDVTSERTSVSNIKVQLNNVFDQKVAYLCVFNNGEWKPISWGKIASNSIVKFDQIGRNIVYNTAYYNNNSLVLTGQPFILEKSGNRKAFYPIETSSRCIKIYHIGSSQGIGHNDNGLLPNTNYRLSFFKNNSWIELETKTTLQDKKGLSYLTYTKVPDNALLRVVKVNGKDLERIFTYENNMQIWH
ncbi:hypothetical protein C3K47_15560 [Solitalea longa]|uniref:Transglutaminase-like domain-containing protein n=1 Tax=Solitalea longa TaxID=2079460 RepID=A0A2S4ZYQ8_9SPHI|nr:transglutaminase domain-containing protein [Solitalea longa]POY35475.1 hypothetical protein C3K47_15560 [Solitalea longa]